MQEVAAVVGEKAQLEQRETVVQEVAAVVGWPKHSQRQFLVQLKL